MSSSTVDSVAASGSVNSFGWQLLRRAVAKQPNCNVVLAPASVATAVAMTMAGAVGETAAELAKALQFKEADEGVQLAAKLNGSLARGRAGVVMATANRLFAERSLALRKEFADILKEAFEAEVCSLNFVSDPEPSRSAINDWVSSRTNGKIANLLPAGSVNSDTRSVLVNAVHFKGKWLHPFHSAATYDGQFEPIANGERIPVRVMSQTRDFLYSETRHTRSVELPFVGDECSCVILLPNERHKLDEALAACGGVHRAIEEAGKTAQSLEVDLHVPKFKIESQLSLEESAYLPDCGAVRVFDRARAQLDKISDERLFVSKVVHKAVLEFDEEGAEAAAATAVAIECMCMPMNVAFMVTEPFILAIKENKTNCLLFLAKVAKPE